MLTHSVPPLGTFAWSCICVGFRPPPVCVCCCFYVLFCGVVMTQEVLLPSKAWQGFSSPVQLEDLKVYSLTIFLLDQISNYFRNYYYYYSLPKACGSCPVSVSTLC